VQKRGVFALIALSRH